MKYIAYWQDNTTLEYSSKQEALDDMITLYKSSKGIPLKLVLESGEEWLRDKLIPMILINSSKHIMRAKDA